MFDSRIRPLIDPPLNVAGRRLARAGITADGLTIAGGALGVLAAIAAALGWFGVGLLLLVANRLADGLDGAVARATVKTDRGGFLDITLDFVVYATVPLGFALYDPVTNGVAAAALLASFTVNGTCFLAYATMAAKRGLETTAQGAKSLFYLSGIAEGFETIVVFIAFFVFPAWFAPIAWAFAAVCFISATARIAMGWRTL